MIVSEISRSGDSNDAVAAESGCVKVRVIENIKNLRPELETESLAKWNFLEQGKVQAVKSRPNNLRRTTAQSGQGAGGTARCCARPRLRKRCWITKPT